MSVVNLRNKRTKKPARKRAPRDLVALDENSGAARYYAKMQRDITRDLGGRRELTRIESELRDIFCGGATHLKYLIHQILLGDSSALDVAGYSQLSSTVLRIGSRLGVSRRVMTRCHA